ncbi:MAG: DNA damage-induced cell division inhibitor SosA, partial [Staphylococcus epidermidis]|nr:DNA damage-induced cell division inhibitor SosA [Staphylococcus epidermidis]
TFFLSVNQGAQSEQTYEMTDHKIHQHNQKGTTQNYKDKQNSEQNDQSVFALVN